MPSAAISFQLQTLLCLWAVSRPSPPASPFRHVWVHWHARPEVRRSLTRLVGSARFLDDADIAAERLSDAVQPN